MLKKTQKMLHKKFSQILEAALKPEQLDQLQIIADHAFLGENWDKAFYYCAIAGQKVFELNIFSSSARLYERALIAAEHLPQDDVLLLKKMRVHYELYCALVPLGRFSDQYSHLQKALEIALAKKDVFFESIVNSALAIHFLGYKDANVSVKIGEKAYQTGKQVRSVDAIMIAQAILSHCYFFLAKFKELFTIAAEMEVTIGGDLDLRTEWLRAPINHIARLYEFAGRALVGDFAYIEAKKEKWFASSPNLKEPSIANLCRYAAMGILYYMKGEFEQALQYLPTALQYSINNEVIIWEPIFMAMIGDIQARLNQPKLGRDLIDQAIAIVDKLHANFTTVFSFPTITSCLSVLGENGKAKEFSEKSLSIVTERNVNLVRTLLLGMNADIELSLPDPNFATIKQKIDEALQLSTQYGMLPSVGHCHLVLSRFYHKKGELDNEKSELKAALATYEKLGMTYWIKLVQSTRAE